jgi:hypothetical protein
MDQLKHISAQTVFQVGYLSVALDFKAASRYLLLRLRLMTKDFPLGH